eukprot:m51a1_g8643 putative carbohydrate-binding module family 20 protein (613) ;mRNA; f:6133-8197
MGFDALWLSPVVENTAGGYHGYWARNFSRVSPQFGGERELKLLVDECHRRGMLVMLDWVSNHVGPVGDDFAQIDTFSDGRYYHGCAGCSSSCSIYDYHDYEQAELCRLSGLPDLNDSVPEVRAKLAGFANALLATYGFDGMRIDTVPHMAVEYWESFRASVDSFMIGEILDGQYSRVADYQSPLDSTLSYPTYYTLRNVFASKASATALDAALKSNRAAFLDTTVLGSFVDNHDQARFLNAQGDRTLYRNALAHVVLGEGIPFVYYGTEQELSGGSDPANREALWTKGYGTGTAIYKFLATLNAARKSAHLWDFPQTTVFSSDTTYAFTRGPVIVVLQNTFDTARTIVATAGTSLSVPLLSGEPVVFSSQPLHTVDASSSSSPSSSGKPPGPARSSEEPTPAQRDKSDNGLSTGALVGIIVGCVGGTLVIVFIVLVIVAIVILRRGNAAARRSRLDDRAVAMGDIEASKPRGHARSPAADAKPGSPRAAADARHSVRPAAAAGGAAVATAEKKQAVGGASAVAAGDGNNRRAPRSQAQGERRHSSHSASHHHRHSSSKRRASARVPSTTLSDPVDLSQMQGAAPPVAMSLVLKTPEELAVEARQSPELSISP